MPEKYCTGCGQEFKVEDKFCGSCGYKRKIVIPPRNKKTRRENLLPKDQSNKSLVIDKSLILDEPSGI